MLCSLWRESRLQGVREASPGHYRVQQREADLAQKVVVERMDVGSETHPDLKPTGRGAVWMWAVAEAGVQEDSLVHPRSLCDKAKGKSQHCEIRISLPGCQAAPDPVDSCFCPSSEHSEASVWCLLETLGQVVRARGHVPGNFCPRASLLGATPL